MALAEAVWIDPPRSYDRRRQIVTTSRRFRTPYLRGCAGSGYLEISALTTSNAVAFFSHIENLGTSAANVGRPRLRLIAINNRTEHLMTRRWTQLHSASTIIDAERTFGYDPSARVVLDRHAVKSWTDIN